MNLILYIYLFIASAMDICRRRVSNRYIAIGFYLGVIWRAMEAVSGDVSIISIVKELLSGSLYIVLFLILFLLRIVGAADVKILCVIGFAAGDKYLGRGLYITAVYAVIFAIITIFYNLIFLEKKGCSQHYMPLIPAIMLGMLSANL